MFWLWGYIPPSLNIGLLVFGSNGSFWSHLCHQNHVIEAALLQDCGLLISTNFTTHFPDQSYWALSRPFSVASKRFRDFPSIPSPLSCPTPSFPLHLYRFPNLLFLPDNSVHLQLIGVLGKRLFVASGAWISYQQRLQLLCSPPFYSSLYSSPPAPGWLWQLWRRQAW